MSNALTEQQIEVAKAFFEIEESGGFVVSGGAALLALGLSNRSTRDLDIFTSPPIHSVIQAMRSFTQAAESRGWTIETITVEDTFCRFIVDLRNGVVLVDLAVDSALLGEPTITVLGPMRAHRRFADSDFDMDFSEVAELRQSSMSGQVSFAGDGSDFVPQVSDLCT